MDVGDLSPGMMTMDNFDDGELDQYLPTSGHPSTGRSCRAAMPPPPPYATSTTSSESTTTSTNSSWMSSGSYRMASSVSSGGSTASGMLQRMASTQVASDTDSATSMSPSSDTASPPKDTCAGYHGSSSQQSGSYHDNSDTSHYGAGMAGQSQQSVKMEPHLIAQYQRDPKHNYELQLSHYGSGYHGNQSSGGDNVSEYSPSAQQQQQYYMSQPGMSGMAGYAAMSSGMRPLYPGNGQQSACAVPVNTAQWKYGHI